MSSLDQVLLIPRQRREDARGWLLKVIDGHEVYLPDKTGEFYLTYAIPGQVRGNHYHQRTSEWFTVVMGEAMLALVDPQSGERRELPLTAQTPQTIYVPAGVAHAFKNPAEAAEPMLLVAYADTLYDPADTFPLELW